METVRSTGLALVRNVHQVLTRLPVDLGRPLDVAGRSIDHLVVRDAGPLHLGTVCPVIDVAEMSPERTALHAARHGEVRLRARWRPDNPATARYEIGTGRRRCWRSCRT